MSNAIRLKAHIQNKYNSLEEWNKITPGQVVPLKGEVFYGIDTNNSILYQKIGDGLTDFVDLPWLLNQSDWNEEDRNSPTFIKNKPFYSLYEPLTTILPSSTYNYVYVEDYGFNVPIDEEGDMVEILIPMSDEKLYPLFKDQQLKVTFDGVDYIVTVGMIPNSDYVVIGNTTLIKDFLDGVPEQDTALDFCGLMEFYSSEDFLGLALTMVTTDTSNSHTFSIEYLNPPISIATIQSPVSDMGSNMYVFEIESNLSDYLYHLSSLYWLALQDYDFGLTINKGITEYHKLRIDDDLVYFGNAHYYDSSFPDTKENFLFIFDSDYIQGGVISDTYLSNIEVNFSLPNIPIAETYCKTIPAKYLDIEVPYEVSSSSVHFDKEIYAPIDGVVRSIPSYVTSKISEVQNKINSVQSNVNSLPHLTKGGQVKSEYGSISTSGINGWSTNTCSPDGKNSWVEGAGGSQKTLSCAAYVRIKRQTANGVTQSTLYLEIPYSDKQRYKNLIKSYTFVDFKIGSTTYSGLVKTVFIEEDDLYVKLSWCSYGNSFDISVDDFNNTYITNCTFFSNLGENSHSENSSTALGTNSHAQGLSTIAKGQNQFTTGRFNNIDYSNEYAVIVGNGVDDSARSNAFSIDWQGNVNCAGEVRAKKFIGSEEEAFGKITSTYIVLNDITSGVDYALQMNNGQITVEEMPAIIFIASPPTKMTYQIGEQFDPTGMVVLKGYQDGRCIPVTNFTCSYTNYESFLQDGEIEVIIKAKCPALYTTSLYVTVEPLTLAENLLNDFNYRKIDDHYDLTSWKQTLNGEPSSILSVPNNSLITM